MSCPARPGLPYRRSPAAVRALPLLHPSIHACPSRRRRNLASCLVDTPRHEACMHACMRLHNRIAAAARPLQTQGSSIPSPSFLELALVNGRPPRVCVRAGRNDEENLLREASLPLLACSSGPSLVCVCRWMALHQASPSATLTWRAWHFALSSTSMRTNALPRAPMQSMPWNMMVPLARPGN